MGLVEGAPSVLCLPLCVVYVVSDLLAVCGRERVFRETRAELWDLRPAAQKLFPAKVSSRLSPFSPASLQL